MILFLGLLAPCIVLAATPAGAVPGEESAEIGALLARLEQNMASIKTLQAGFHQEKELAIFSQKVTLEGRVYFEKPSLFAWRVLTPMRYSVVIDGDELRQWDEETDRVQEISMKKNVAFQGAVRQMKEWLSGAYSSLQKEYIVGVESKDPLVLQFVPLETSVARSFVRRVTIFFQEDEKYIHQIQMEENNGDKMSLSFTDIQINNPIDRAVWEVQAHVR